MNKSSWVTVLFLFIALLGWAQMPTVSLQIMGPAGEKLEGVTVFDAQVRNNLISISDSEGKITLPLKKRLTFHKQGYNDTLAILSADTRTIGLSITPRLLPSPDRKPTGTRTLLLALRPDALPSINEALGAPPGNFSKRLCLAVVPQDGYLSSFLINAKKEGKGELLESTHLLIYSEEDGRPGKLLINDQITGKIKGKHLVFKPVKDSIFLATGSYFIGCDVYSTQLFSSYSAKHKPAYISACYRKTVVPELFMENNLGEWKPFTITNTFNHRTNFYSFGYQLELKTPLTK